MSHQPALADAVVDRGRFRERGHLVRLRGCMGEVERGDVVGGEHVG